MSFSLIGSGGSGRSAGGSHLLLRTSLSPNTVVGCHPPAVLPVKQDEWDSSLSLSLVQILLFIYTPIYKYGNDVG